MYWENLRHTLSILGWNPQAPVKKRKSKIDRKTCRESQSGCSYLNVLQYYKFVCFGEYVTYFLLIFATVRLLPIIVKKVSVLQKVQNDFCTQFDFNYHLHSRAFLHLFFYKLPVLFLKHTSASYSPSICVSLFMLEVILAAARAK